MNYKGYTIKIEQDNDALNPCTEFDNLGTMVFWHRCMNLGHVWNETNKLDPREWLINWLESNRDDLDPEVLEVKSMDELMLDFKKTNLVVPVFAYEHGGITIKARSKGIGWDSWDSGQLGFTYVTHERIREEYDGEEWEQALVKAERVLVGEVGTYDDYLIGQVYGYIIEDDDENHLDSCWGYYGDDGKREAQSQAEGYIDWKIEDDAKQAQLINACWAE